MREIVNLVVLAASVHDNAAGIALLDKAAADTDTVEKALVDQGFKNAVVADGVQVGIEVEIVERNPARTGLVPIPVLGDNRGDTASADRGHRWGLAQRMTGELTLGAVPARPEEREREIAAQAETTREYQATIGLIVGMLVTLPGGLALLVLGPLVALTTSGDAFERVINGGVIAGFGGSGIWASTQLPRLNHWYPRNSMK
ncbi:hypothetical protein ACFVW1_00120 [Streptomyces olivochromogenes]|uniref:hypothetical protein n=1 Tax=Streptomyces olivochromogenes TaxID=1963 RepID=UPI0036DAEBA0